MSDVTKLRLARIARIENNHEVTPEELLILALHDARSPSDGRKPKAAMIMVLMDGENGESMIEYRCKMNRAEEVGYLDLWKTMRIESWRE